MADLISRQAASDEIDEWIKAFLENGHKESAADARLIQDGIIQLPSAQPEIIRCKDCKHRIVNENAGEPGYLKLKAMCELDTGDIFELGRNAWDDDWFCADAERRE